MGTEHCCCVISIHSLVKRETLCFRLFVLRYGHFNPLPRKEGDVTMFIIFYMGTISIHSLVKRETTQEATKSRL